MSTFLNTTKHISTITDSTKSTTSVFSNTQQTLYNQFILLETGSYLLQENGSKLILEQSIPTMTYSNLQKS